MVEADPVMRAGRNGFAVLIVVLLGLGIYEYVVESDLAVPAVWAIGVVTFYASQYYYRRQKAGDGEGDAGVE
jgi:hypothetical protein